jgi:hypothetical protein
MALPMRRFAPLLLVLILVLVAGGVAFQQLYMCSGIKNGVAAQ